MRSEEVDQLAASQSTGNTYTVSFVCAALMLIATARIIQAYRLPMYDEIDPKALSRQQHREKKGSSAQQRPAFLSFFRWSGVSSLFSRSAAKVHVKDGAPRSDHDKNSPNTTVDDHRQSPLVRHRTLTTFFLETLPIEFKNVSRWAIFRQALRHRHVLSMHENYSYQRDILSHSKPAASTSPSPLTESDKDPKVDIYSLPVYSNAYVFANSHHIFTSSYYKALKVWVTLVSYLLCGNILFLVIYSNHIRVDDIPGSTTDEGQILPCEDLQDELLCTNAVEGFGFARLCSWDRDSLACSYTTRYLIASPAFIFTTLSIFYLAVTLLSGILVELVNCAIMYVYRHNAHEILKNPPAGQPPTSNGQIPINDSQYSGPEGPQFNGRSAFATLNPFVQTQLHGLITLSSQEDTFVTLQTHQANYMKSVLVGRLRIMLDGLSTEEELEELLSWRPPPSLTFAQAVKLDAHQSRRMSFLQAQREGVTRQSKQALRKSYDYSDSFKAFKSSKLARGESSKGSRRGRATKIHSSLRLSRDLGMTFGQLASAYRLSPSSDSSFSVQSSSRSHRPVDKKDQTIAEELRGLYTLLDNDRLTTDQLLSTARYYRLKHHCTVLTHRLQNAKQSAKQLAKQLNTLPSSFEQDKFLFVQYLLYSLPHTLARKVANQVIWGNGHVLDYYLRLSPSFLLIVFGGCLCLLSLAVFAMFYYSVQVDAAGATMWCVLLAAVLSCDWLIVQPAEIYFQAVILPRLARLDFLALHALFSHKAKTLLRRRSQLLTANVHESGHSFNPVLRLVRRVMKLPVSRMLIAVNGYDRLLLDKIRSAYWDQSSRRPEQHTLSLWNRCLHQAGLSIKPISTAISLKWILRNSRHNVLVIVSRLVSVLGRCLHWLERRCITLLLYLPRSGQRLILECLLYACIMAIGYSLWTTLLIFLPPSSSSSSSFSLLTGLGWLAAVLVLLVVGHEWLPSTHPVLFFPLLLGGKEMEIQNRLKAMQSRPSSLAAERRRKEGAVAPSPSVPKSSPLRDQQQANQASLPQIWIPHYSHPSQTDGGPHYPEEGSEDDEFGGGERGRRGKAMPIAPHDFSHQGGPPHSLSIQQYDSLPESPLHFSPHGERSSPSGSGSDYDRMERGASSISSDRDYSSSVTSSTHSPSPVRGKARQVHKSKRDLLRRHLSPVTRDANDPFWEVQEDDRSVTLGFSPIHSEASSPRISPHPRPMSASVADFSSRRPDLQFFQRYDSSAFLVSGKSAALHSGKVSLPQDIVRDVDYGADPFHARRAQARPKTTQHSPTAVDRIQEGHESKEDEPERGAKRQGKSRASRSVSFAQQLRTSLLLSAEANAVLETSIPSEGIDQTIHQAATMWSPGTAHAVGGTPTGEEAQYDQPVSPQRRVSAQAREAPHSAEKMGHGPVPSSVLSTPAKKLAFAGDETTPTVPQGPARSSPEKVRDASQAVSEAIQQDEVTTQRSVKSRDGQGSRSGRRNVDQPGEELTEAEAAEAAEEY